LDRRDPAANPSRHDGVPQHPRYLQVDLAIVRDIVDSHLDDVLAFGVAIRPRLAR